MQMDWQSVVVWCFKAVMRPKDADGLADDVETDQAAPLGTV